MQLYLHDWVDVGHGSRCVHQVKRDSRYQDHAYGRNFMRMMQMLIASNLKVGETKEKEPKTFYII